MTVDVIPAGERGSFRLTDAMMTDADATTMAAFEVLILAEAERRRLDVSFELVVETQDVIVSWRPVSPR